MRTCIALLLLTICVACSSSGSTSSASSVPAPQVGEVPADKGRIYFFRKSGMKSGAVRPSVLLNGESVGTAVPGTWFHVDRVPGTYEVKCSVVTDHVITFPLAAGETVYVELRATMGIYVGHVKPRVVSESAGKTGVGKCAHAGGS
ncbi:MAG: DUF2846 domain-containing protein [Planctomycetota bacterium]|jgi:hypothetical protein